MIVYIKMLGTYGILGVIAKVDFEVAVLMQMIIFQEVKANVGVYLLALHSLTPFLRSGGGHALAEQ
jgi:hypothetical protein